MMQFKKARLGLAMAVALVGGMSVTNTASAAAISANGLGEALIFPYYTVRDGFTSMFNITNTSADTVAVKVRFRESHNSRDVLDFNLVLSPYDVWTGFLTDSDAGPVLKSEDNSCTSPQMSDAGFTASNAGYSGSFADSSNTDIDRAREGYVEVIMMGRAAAGEESDTTNLVAYNAKHVSGTPRNCSTVDEQFLATTAPVVSAAVVALPSPNGTPAAATHLDILAGTNPLKGNFTLLNKDNGVAGGTEAVAIEDFSVLNLVTAQQYPYFLEPTLVSTGGLWTVADDVVAILQRASMINEWANTPKTGATVDWVVSMPTKNFFVDCPSDTLNANTGVEDNFQAAMNSARGYDYTVTSPICDLVSAGLTAVPAFNDAFDGVSNVAMSYSVYDREEGSYTASATVVSPQPPGTVEALKYEVNVLTFDGNTALGSEVASNVDVPQSNLSTPNGWASANIGSGAIPAVGFIWKQRNQGNAALNYGSIINHAYTD